MIRKMSKRWCYAIALCGVVAIGASDLQAGFTQINGSHSPKSGKEANHEQILEHRYGGNFVANGVNYSNGTVNVTRIDDFGSSPTDSVWNERIVSASAVAAFAKRKQSFGYFAGADKGQFSRLFDVAGTKFDVAGSVEDANLNGTLRFGRNENPGKSFSSLASDNRDGADHLVSYRVTDAKSQNPSYLLFWEDKSGKRSDFDFNDLVVEVQAQGEPLLVPLPAAAWSGLAGLAAMGLFTGCKRTRRWIF